ncbi:hypothetical protein TTHERM_00133600 (macronuclear) [Tetrahymena thermophila SB210]|uniref:Uncharacterized protein n=1 Tax=Tetrahymena thermophila (strain SB210) TaxID=312017 RepID=I7LVN2_TETTS|nr:hypothetical protein TTHERM_00133600 [Tetrahymena thermophila SB210]EAR99394.1 hypothetical protein TTHERM_00133600 [Tetrahymena thermophila SB210]|eukprot:XP_001019639.1 hypothetical protein TTHERM_00133600 [Tetrahymena thermophila SB210]
MDEFEVIYTEEDIKAVQNQLNSLTKSYNQLVKEKKDIEIFVDTLREKVHSLESTKQLYEQAQQQLQTQKQSIQDLQKKQEAILAQKNEQDNKLIKVMKEKYNIQQELEKIKSSNEELSVTMIDEMEEMKKKMNITFQEQSKIQQEATRQQILQLQQLSQQKLIEKQMEYEEICNLLEKTNQELSYQQEMCKELEKKLEYSAEKIKELSNKLAEEKANVEALKKQLDEYREKYQKNLASQNQLKDELLNAQAKIKQLTTQLQQITDQQQLISGESSNYRSQLSKMEEEHRNLVEIQKFLSNENSELSNQSLNFKKQIEQLQNQQQEFKKAIESKDQAIEKLNLEKSQDLVKLETNYRSKIDSQMKDIDQLTNRLNEVEMNYAKTLDKLESSENTCRDLLQQIQNLQNELQSQKMIAQENINQLTQKLKEKEEKLAAVQKKYEQNLFEISQKEQQNNSYIQDLNKEVNNLKNIVTTKSRENEILQNQNQSIVVLEEKLKISLQQLQQGAQKEEKYRIEIEEIAMQKEQYEKLMHETTNRINQMSMQLKQCKEEISSLETKIEQDRKQYNVNLEEEKQKNEFANSQIQELQFLCQKLKEEILENENVLSYTQQQLQQTEEQLQSAKDQINIMNQAMFERESYHSEVLNQQQNSNLELNTLKLEKENYLNLVTELQTTNQQIKQDNSYLKSENDNLKKQFEELLQNNQENLYQKDELLQQNENLSQQYKVLKQENHLILDNIQQIKQELESKNKIQSDDLRNANNQVNIAFSTFSQLFSHLALVVGQQVRDEQLLDTFNQSSQIQNTLDQLNLSSNFESKLNFMKESMTQFLSTIKNMSDERLQNNQVSLQLKQQVAQLQQINQNQLEQSQSERQQLQSQIQELEQSNQQLNQEIAKLKQQANQCISPSNQNSKDNFYNMNYEQLENDYKISQSILLDQKQQLKDLKYDLEQKIKKYQEENQVFAQQNKELQDKVSLLEAQKTSLSKEYGEQQNCLNDCFDKIQYQEQEIQNLQQLLEESDFENVLLKKIQQNNELNVEEESRNKMNSEIIESAKQSISNIARHFNLNQK